MGFHPAGPVTTVVGVYPLLDGATPTDEAELYAALGAHTGVDAIELPWSGELHPQGASWLLDALPPPMRVVITAIPGTMASLAIDPLVGLASVDPDGRSRALADMTRIVDAARALNDAAGRAVVAAIEVHSAPSAAHADAIVLRDSLETLSSLDVDGARLLLEHVDAAVPGRTPAKGFLPLTDEVGAVAGLPVGIVINWARSAIELHDPDRVVEHIVAAREAGVLAGLMLSGVASTETAYGPAWADAHLPLAPRVAASLLTLDRARAALAAAGEPEFVGAKMSWRGEATTDARLAVVFDALEPLLPTAAGADRF